MATEYLEISFKARYQCYRRMPTPGHPSAADDAWYWQKCISSTLGDFCDIWLFVATEL